MPKPESYSVISNPFPDPEELLVLFSGSAQTVPDHKVGPKVVDYYLIHHVLEGRGTFTCLGQQYELGAGDSFLIQPDTLITYAADEREPWSYQWVAFSGSLASGLVASTGLSPRQPVLHSQGRGISVLFQRIKNTLKLRKPSLNLKVNGYLHLLLAEYKEASHPDTDGPDETNEMKKTVRQAIHYLSSQYSEPITMERMAENLGYNRAYLSKLFKEHTGITPVTFLLRLRIDNARRMLRERLDLTVEQIAFSVGFRDPLYFSRQFRKMYGRSPTDYRNSIKNL